MASDKTGGIIMMAAAGLAMLAANSPLAGMYGYFAHPAVVIGINDGLMAVFFLLVGLEIRHEFSSGELKGRQGLLPIIAAAGGVIVPACIFSYFNMHTPAMRGWAIPTATDIAFSLGVLSLLGSRVPPALRIFLMAVAVIDDLIAVCIIAAFYTGGLNLMALGAALAITLGLFLYARTDGKRGWVYAAGGIALWAAAFASGVHPTVAGAVLGTLMPRAVGERWEHALKPLVNLGIAPLFAFANAGIPMAAITLPMLLEPVTLGIALGLLLGKPLGIGCVIACMAKSGVAAKPAGATRAQVFGVGMLAGIGFTMSLFIASLAYGESDAMLRARLGISLGSLLSAALGYTLLYACGRRSPGV